MKFGYNIIVYYMMPVMILKLFDSLTPLDQLLLKCASVLGEIINRDMLRYLMQDKSAREIGLGKQIKKMQILLKNFIRSSKVIYLENIVYYFIFYNNMQLTIHTYVYVIKKNCSR